MRALALPLLLVPPTGAVPACGAPVAQSRPEPPRRSCYGGAETVAFGRLLVDYGIATLRFGVGIVLIFLGLVVMALGYLLMLVDLLLCWR
ncbi:hypothetical protein D9599_17285 [Roseomonas sp. KE2513]|uniref:hypothetical protein n=1 Tax=Roseomonas sp. KE2513 TaxID=2479202 RepID=UPI0018E02CB6|nr:hypothetical protein [Roseomonas sp. KE2513]MBI0537321.1 hypothetical protein [Roseomonas sp. KE2513]